ncbi:MAG: hypothetical protein JXA42_00745 [Anaerolineales bacterium]|nr:hypothetical protein [Anaerolineales bacterium]
MSNPRDPTKKGRGRNTMAPSLQWTLWGGIMFSLVFTAVIWWASRRLDAIELLPDQGAAWYYWKLPLPTVWSQVTAWGFYFFHQVAFWGLIYYARTRVKRYANGLNRINIAAMAVNAFFILLHFGQTHLWYDGLAQNTPVWSSQGSVILMLVLILLMENQRRGLFFGKKVPLSKRIIRLVRDYHGYIFSWAVVYTFWFHPMVATSGHLIGFFYMFLLMLQGSLFFTRLHINRWWMFVQEATVLIHGALVAVMQGNDLWPMFAFGFAGILVITQMHGLGLSKRIRWGIFLLYIFSALAIYSQRGWVRINEIIRIPVIEYLLVFVLAGLIGAGLWLRSLVQKPVPRG